MNNRSATGLIRTLCFILLCMLVTPYTASAASFEWAKINDHERVTIKTRTNEGMSTSIARIDPKALAVTFSTLPPDIIKNYEFPDAQLVDRVAFMGTALVIHTKTNAFGFVISQQTPTAITLDIFSDPLGTRWKSSNGQTAQPVTPIAPTTNSSTPVEQSAIAAPQTNEQQTRQPEAPTHPASNTENQALPQQAATTQALPAQTQPDQTTPLATETAAPSANHDAAQPQEQNGVGLLGAPIVPAGTTAGGGNAILPATVAQVSENPHAALSAIEKTPSTPENRAETASTPLQTSTARTSAAEDISTPATGSPETPSGQNTPTVQSAVQIPPDAKGTQTPPPPPNQEAPQTAKQPAPVRPLRLDELPIGRAVPFGQNFTYRGRINEGSYDNITPTGEATAPKQTDTNATHDQARPPAPPANATGQESPSTQLPATIENATSHAPSTESPASTHAQEAQANATAPEQIYTDADGNIIPPPLDPVKTLEQINTDMLAGNFEAALGTIDILLAQNNLDKEQREEALHLKASAFYGLHKDELLPYFQQIVDTTTQAINFNLQSKYNAGAYLRLGFINLEMNNPPLAEAHFNILRRQFPDHKYIPLTYVYWGDYYYKKDDWLQAADQYQTVLEKYPNSPYTKDAALGLAKSYYQLGYYEKAFSVIDFIRSKWDRFYISYPVFLNMVGDAAFRLNKYQDALDYYWLYANIEPAGEKTDLVLTRIGDIYTLQRHTKAAQLVYSRCAELFPDKDGGLVAKIRLAESSITDSPSVSMMESIFDKPYRLNPKDVYTEIIEKHPQSPLAPMAELKLAMWYLWKKDYLTTLDTCTSFMNKYPESDLAPNVRDLALKTFAAIAIESNENQRFNRLQEIWDKYPLVRQQEKILDPESRIALAVSFWKDNKPNEALAVIDPFFLGRKVPITSEAALSLALNIYLENQQWESIRQVKDRVALWELTAKSQRQLDYALALAAENLGENDVAAPLWEKLYNEGALDNIKMTYALYFMGQQALRNGELQKAYSLGTEAYSRLKKMQEDSPNPADQGKMLSQLNSLFEIAETAGRLDEALSLGSQYLGYLPDQDPERAIVMYRIAQIYKKQGDDDAWKTQLIALTQQFPDSIYAKAAASALRRERISENASRFSPTGEI